MPFYVRRVLSPFKKKHCFRVCGLDEVPALIKGPPDTLVIVTSAEIVVSAAFVPFLDGFHDGDRAVMCFCFLILASEAFALSLRQFPERVFVGSPRSFF